METGTDTSRWPALDGVRAFAVALVVATHFHLDAPDGQIGVDVFFVLSGFLITTLLLKEQQRTNRISLSQFWKRRALRLFPALGCAIVLALVLSLLVTPALRDRTWAGLPFVLLYVGNVDKAFGGSQTLGLLVHTWSLAVEEQFYLVWPILGLVWCRGKHRRLMSLIVAGGAVADAVYFVGALHHWGAPRAIFSSDTHCFGLLAGAALALWLGRSGVLPHLEGRPAIRLQACGLFATLVIVMVAVTSPLALSLVLATIAALVLVAALVLTEGRVTGAYAWKPLSWVGQRSYGIYLYHFPLSVTFESLHLVGSERVVGSLACIGFSVWLAAASYRWVESPFLRRRRPQQALGDAVLAPGSVWLA